MGKGSSLKHYQMVANLSQGRKHGHQIYTGSLNLTLRHYQGKRLFFQLLQDRLCSATHSVLCWFGTEFSRIRHTTCICLLIVSAQKLEYEIFWKFPPWWKFLLLPFWLFLKIYLSSHVEESTDSWMVWTDRVLGSALGSVLETSFVIVVVEMLSLHSVANLLTDLLRNFC